MLVEIYAYNFILECYEPVENAVVEAEEANEFLQNWRDSGMGYTAYIMPVNRKDQIRMLEDAYYSKEDLCN